MQQSHSSFIIYLPAHFNLHPMIGGKVIYENLLTEWILKNKIFIKAIYFALCKNLNNALYGYS